MNQIQPGRRLLRCAAVALCVGALPALALAQEDSGPESLRAPSSSPTRTVTNDDFGVTRKLPETVKPAPVPARPTVVTPAPAKPAAPPPEVSAEAGKPIEDLPEYEMVARQDEAGNWVLVSRRVPGTPKPAPGQPATPVAPGVSPSFGTLTAPTTGKPELDVIVSEMSKKYGVDPRLIVEVMRQESGFKQYVVSYAGAKGLMQLMDGTAARMGTRDSFDMRQNVEGGTKYLRLLLDMFNGDISLALAGYNAGEHRVIRSGNQVPNIAQTQHYVRTIMARYKGGTVHSVNSKQSKPTQTPTPSAKKNEPPPPPPMRVEQQNGVVLLTNH
jgi:soluble lytic murein transglycosylase-like protein